MLHMMCLCSRFSHEMNQRQVGRKKKHKMKVLIDAKISTLMGF